MTKSDSQSDLEILAQIKLGRVQLFEEIVHKYQPKILAFCRHMLADQALAEDAAQEVFVKAWQSIKDFRPDSSFSAWIFRIARNRCIDFLRSNKHSSRSITLDDFEEGIGSTSPVDRLGQDFNIDRSEARDMLRCLLRHMSPNAREVLLLKEMYGFSYEEIAQVLECSLDAVKSRLKRARVDAMQHLRHFSSPLDVSMNRSTK